MRLQRFFFAIALILLLSACTSPTINSNTTDELAPMDEGTVIDPSIKLKDFSMASSLGRDVSLSEFQGKPVIIFFGYTFCPDVCPITLAELKRTKEMMGDQGDQLQVLFISVDAERDTPEVLQRYMAAFDDGFIGLQGDEASLRSIGSDYGLYYQKREVEGSSSYLVDHSSPSYLIDTNGQLRIIYSYGTSPEVIANGVQKLLTEQ